MGPLRPDLVECWVFRIALPGVVEILLIRRAAGRLLTGLWQCVTGSLEPGESVALAALREVHEETGIDPSSIEAFYHLDQVNQFYEASVDGVLTAAVFAVRVQDRTEPILSTEHDASRWVTADEARGVVIWPAYLESITRIERDLTDHARAIWFELTLDGQHLRV